MTARTTGISSARTADTLRTAGIALVTRYHPLQLGCQQCRTRRRDKQYGEDCMNRY
jgi:hypothetical protein